jgi:hypothetical protein
MRYKLKLLILTISIISIISSGCIKTNVQPLGNVTGNLMKINYMDKNTIIKGGDFPDFKLADNLYYIAQENLSLTPEAEMGHGVYEMSPNATTPQGYRIYGGSEAYNTRENSSLRYMILQYKVFDNNASLDAIINNTAVDIYIKNGYKYKSINNAYKGTVVALESNVTNHTDMNVTVILFGFDTIIGKIGVRDYSNKSLNESLQMLSIAVDRLKVRTKDVKSAGIGSIQ